MIMIFRTKEGLGPNGKAPSAEAVPTPAQTSLLANSCPGQFSSGLHSLPFP